MIKVLIALNTLLAFIATFESKSIVLNEADDIQNICKNRKCIRKCCPKDQYVNITKSKSKCERIEGNFDFQNVPVYNNDVHHLLKINKTLSDMFLLTSGIGFATIDEQDPENETLHKMIDLSKYNISTYLTENGNLYMNTPNSDQQWSLANDFCIDYEVNKNITHIKFWSYFETALIEDNYTNLIELLVSSVFLFIVLLIYILLPELQNLVGMILMAYVISLMGAFLSLASLQISNYPPEVCIFLTAITYFFFLATFCWMNVMSYDIWWTFRGYVVAKPIHRRGIKFKFIMFCLYAFGVPFLMAVGLVVINNADFSHIPWFIKPRIPEEGCFLQNGQKMVYLYIPMLILIAFNWLFYVMTAINIWSLSRSTAVLESEGAGRPPAHRTQRNRFIIYLKLSVIMGINWVLEMGSYFAPNLYIWNFINSYNLLVGFLIFLIFVCKKKIYRKLCNRYCGHFCRKPRLTKSSVYSNKDKSITSSTLFQGLPNATHSRIVRHDGNFNLNSA